MRLQDSNLRPNAPRLRVLATTAEGDRGQAPLYLYSTATLVRLVRPSEANTLFFLFRVLLARMPGSFVAQISCLRFFFFSVFGLFLVFSSFLLFSFTGLVFLLDF